jgi:hypothetical protein
VPLFLTAHESVVTRVRPISILHGIDRHHQSMRAAFEADAAQAGVTESPPCGWSSRALVEVAFGVQVPGHIWRQPGIGAGRSRRELLRCVRAMVAGDLVSRSPIGAVIPAGDWTTPALRCRGRWLMRPSVSSSRALSGIRTGSRSANENTTPGRSLSGLHTVGDVTIQDFALRR